MHKATCKYLLKDLHPTLLSSHTPVEGVPVLSTKDLMAGALPSLEDCISLLVPISVPTPNCTLLSTKISYNLPF